MVNYAGPLSGFARRSGGLIVSRQVDADSIRKLLEQVHAGSLSPDRALAELKDLPFRSLGFANADTHRQLRTGYAEVIFAPGKTAAQISMLLAELGRGGATVIASRVSPEQADEVLQELPQARYLDVARMLLFGPTPEQDQGRGSIAVLTAGTADIPVAEEAVATCEADGNRVSRIFDVGVAGLHRLLARRDIIEEAEVIIAVAGMDGVLPTVTAGLFARPVIAVPTSVGYGTSFGGVAALLTMLNACAAGVAVVNIDNGFGAGRMASLLNRKRPA